jgi:hypothetical protein
MTDRHDGAFSWFRHLTYIGAQQWPMHDPVVTFTSHSRTTTDQVDQSVVTQGPTATGEATMKIDRHDLIVVVVAARAVALVAIAFVLILVLLPAALVGAGT